MIRKFWDSVWGRALSTVVLLAAGFAFFEWMDCRRDYRILEERVEQDKRFRDSLRVSNIKVSGKGSESETVAETEPETVNPHSTFVPVRSAVSNRAFPLKHAAAPSHTQVSHRTAQ